MTDSMRPEYDLNLEYKPNNYEPSKYIVPEPEIIIPTPEYKSNNYGPLKFIIPKPEISKYDSLSGIDMLKILIEIADCRRKLRSQRAFRAAYNPSMN